MGAILISYIIGFGMSWIFGAAPADFPQTPFTAEETMEIAELKEEIQEDAEDVDSLVRLGQIYFSHNQLEDADQAFSKAKALAPEEGETLAWWGTNKTKLGGAVIPWYWGIYKIVSVKEGMSAINQAVALEPENAIIRLIRIKTLTGLEGRFSNFDLVFEDENYFTSKSSQELNEFPAGLLAQVYLALASSYAYKFNQEGKNPESFDRQKALTYLQQAEQKDEDVREEVIKIRQQL